MFTFYKLLETIMYFYVSNKNRGRINFKINLNFNLKI